MRSYVIRQGSGEESWQEPDLGILETHRLPPPPLPLAAIPQPWRDWIADTERATGAPADHVLQSVLAGVAAVCGAGVAVRVTPAWQEPLVLWQAAVGEPSSGRSAALAPLRGMLDILEQERRLGDEARRAAHEARTDKGGETGRFVPSQIVTALADPPSLADLVAGNPRGLLLWRDEPAAALGAPTEDRDDRPIWRAAWKAGPVTVARWRQPPRSLDHFAVSVLETVRPESLKEALRTGDPGLAARFLFAWPGPQPYRSVAVVEASRDAEILQRLRALSHLARTPDDPCELVFDDRGRAALDGVLQAVHAERQQAEGLAAAWLGRSRSFIVRLAGMIELLASIDGTALRPGQIGSAQVEAAATLWRDYFWPQARAVFDSAVLSEHAQRVRRVARWLRDRQVAAVTREDIRREALSLRATAEETDHVLQRLYFLGYVRPDRGYSGRGRRPNAWEVNPALAELPR